jgi:hypothetical protein
MFPAGSRPQVPQSQASIVVRRALFNAPMSVARATNHNQQRGPAGREGDKFEVMVAGSNGEVFPFTSILVVIHDCLVLMYGVADNCLVSLTRKGHGYCYCVCAGY